MPFCPTCKFEYESPLRRCPDCGSDLVAQLPVEPGPEPLREGETVEVLLCTVQGEIHAGLLRDRLRFQGIPSRGQLAGILESPYYPGTMPAPRGPDDITLRIYVRRGDLARARQVYDDFEKQGGGGAGSEEQL